MAQAEQPVVAHDHGLRSRAQVAGHARALVHIERDAFVVVVAEHAVHAQGMLTQGQQAGFLGGHGNPGARVGVDHAVHLGPRLVHAAVDDEAGAVHAQPGGIVDHVAVLVDLDQR